MITKEQPIKKGFTFHQSTNESLTNSFSPIKNFQSFCASTISSNQKPAIQCCTNLNSINALNSSVEINRGKKTASFVKVLNQQ